MKQNIALNEGDYSKHSHVTVSPLTNFQETVPLDRDDNCKADHPCVCTAVQLFWNLHNGFGNWIQSSTFGHYQLPAIWLDLSIKMTKIIVKQYCVRWDGLSSSLPQPYVGEYKEAPYNLFCFRLYWAFSMAHTELDIPSSATSIWVTTRLKKNCSVSVLC